MALRAMKVRKKQPKVTRQAVLDAAGIEFALNGYNGTGLGSIVARADVTKGALFHHFTDKRALALAWIRESLAAGMEIDWAESLAEIGSLDGLKAFCRLRCLELRAEEATSALVSLAAETAVTDPQLREAVETAFAGWREVISNLLERGKADGWIHRSIQPEAEAAFLTASFAGLCVTTKCNSDESVRRISAAALEGYLETLRAE
jgi:AcrR family transcriptional regulator